MQIHNGDLTTCMGYYNQDELQNTIGTLMSDTICDNEINAENAILHHKEGVDLIPANLDLSAIEFSLVNAMSREFTLKNSIRGIKDNYDYVLIDCMPSLGMITINALACSDKIIIQVQGEYMAVKGMGHLLKTVTRVQKQINPNLKIGGVLLTLVDKRTNLSKDVRDTLIDNYGQYVKIYGAEIPKAINTAKSTSTEEQISTSPIYTKDTLPRIDASLATQPLVSAAVKNFTGEDIKDEDLNYSNTHPGYVKLIDGEKDIIVVTEPSEEELAYAKEKGVELEVIPVVKEGFVFYVNGKNKVNSLTLEQIQKIYSGEITNWKEVGGDDEKIIPYQRPVNSGSQTGILSLVMKGKKLMNPVNNVIETMEGIIKAVANYKDGKGSIGYSYYYYATSMYDLTDTNKENSIKLMGVDGVIPSYETIKDDSYPIRTNYYIVLRKDEPEDSTARKFANDLLSTRGQNVCKEAGYVPVK